MRIYTISYPKTGNYPRPVLGIDRIGEPENTYEHTTATPAVLREKEREFYQVVLDDGNPVVERKLQAEIDAIIATGAQILQDHNQKHTDAHAQLKLNDLTNKTYQQADDWIENNVTNIASAKTVLKKMAKIILAMLKSQDFSD